METAASILSFAEAWLWLGAAVAAVFLTIGIDRIDENARGAFIFRPLLFPAILLIWPLVLWRWAILETGRDDERGATDPQALLAEEVEKSFKEQEQELA